MQMTFLKQFKGRQGQLITIFLFGILLLVISLPVEEKKEKEISEQSEFQEEDVYTKQLEHKLEQILMEIEGVGQAKVMLTFQTSSEKIVEKDENSTVYEHPQTGGEVPYIVQEVFAKPSGILVIAEGGSNAITVQNIREAVQALFGVEAHKIKIMKMRKSS